MKCLLLCLQLFAMYVVAEAAGADAASVRATLVSSPAQPIARKPVILSTSFSRAPNLQPLSTAAFTVSHERMLHLVGVGQDLDTFLHWHPSGKTGAAFTFDSVEFPKAGTYMIALDGQLSDGPVADHTKLVVGGTPRMHPPSKESAAATGLSVTVKSIPFQEHQPAVSLASLTAKTPSSSNVYTARVSGPQGAACQPGKASKYVWSLYHGKADNSSSRDKPVVDLRTYYGAPMHLTVVRDDLQFIQHAHGDVVRSPSSIATSTSPSTALEKSPASAKPGTTSTSPAAAAAGHDVPQHAGHGRKLMQSGRAHGSNSGNMATAKTSRMRPGAGESTAPATEHAEHAGRTGTSGPTIETVVVLPAAGRYLLVGQVLRGGELILLPVYVRCQ